MNPNRKAFLLSPNVNKRIVDLADMGLNDKEILEEVEKPFNKLLAAKGEPALTRSDIYHSRTAGEFITDVPVNTEDLKLNKSKPKNVWLPEGTVTILKEADQDELVDSFVSIASVCSRANDPVLATLRSFHDILSISAGTMGNDAVVLAVTSVYQLLNAYVESALVQSELSISANERAARFYQIYKDMLRDGFDGDQAVMLWRDYIAEFANIAQDGVILDEDEVVE